MSKNLDFRSGHHFDNDPLSLLLNPADDPFVFAPIGDVPDQVAHLSRSATTFAPNTGANLVNSSTTITGVDAHWDGITFMQGGGWYPPDNALAAGTNVVISAENDAIQFTALNGTGALTESLNTFFKSALSSGYFLTDPRVLYDSANHRFIVAVDEVSNNLTSSKILLAVSKTDLSAPSLSSANWSFEAASTTYKINGITTWADQPLVSVDGQDIYVTTNQYSARTGAYIGDVQPRSVQRHAFEPCLRNGLLRFLLPTGDNFGPTGGTFRRRRIFCLLYGQWTGNF